VRDENGKASSNQRLKNRMLVKENAIALSLTLTPQELQTLVGHIRRLAADRDLLPE
jgi:hypothetical protein